MSEILNGPDIARNVSEALEKGGDKSYALYMRADGQCQEFSYNTILEEGEKLRLKLREAGLKRGDRVAVISLLRPFWYSVFYACLNDGIIMACMDPGIPDAQLADMMADCDVRAVFSGVGVKPMPTSLDGKIPTYDIDGGFRLLTGPEKLSAELPGAPAMDKEGCFILFSSGTTGEKRKGVLHSKACLPLSIEYGTATDTGLYKDTVPFPPAEKDMMLFPPYHIAGMLCAYYDLITGAQIIIMERISPQALARTMQTMQPDMICTVPSMLNTLRKKILAQLSEKAIVKPLVLLLLKLCGYIREKTGLKPGRRLLGFINKKALGGKVTRFRAGGSPCDEETMRFYLALGIDMNLTYGLTELGAPLAATGEGYFPVGTGRVLRHTYKMDIRIVNVDEKGRGEVEVLSPLRMISYTDPAKMEGCFTEDGYFRTGDLGYFDKKNCLVICGRAKDTIVLRNGEKLLPEEIEAMYDNILDVAELAVFRVPDEGCDAFSIAAIKNKANGIPDEVVRLTIADRAANLPAIYAPREIYMLNELPLSSTKKVQRFRLTEMAVAGMARPKNETDMRRVSNQGTAAILQEILSELGGAQWKTGELTEGMPLNLDSLRLMDLFVAVQENFGVDLFQLASQPETFGQLLDAVENYSVADKNSKPQLDLQEYPLPSSGFDRMLVGTVEQFARFMYGVRCSGLENLPDEGSFILCSNHLTVLDPGWICAFLRRRQRHNTAVVGKSEVLSDKKLRVLVRGQNLIPVDRTGNTRVTLERCAQLLEEGWNVLIFPEGTNFENAKSLMPLKEGPARLAISTGCPIVPVHIKGIRARNADQQSYLPRLGGKVQLCFGAPVYPQGNEAAELNEILRAAIEAL